MYIFVLLIRRLLYNTITMTSNDIPATGSSNSKRDSCGNILCPHGKRRYRCVACNGAGICEHNHIKYTCKECKPVPIIIDKSAEPIQDAANVLELPIASSDSTIIQTCIHGKRRYRCVECGGPSICQHKKLKYTCKDCKGSGICPHDKIKANCIECRGTNVCPHNRIKYTCKECKGNGVCTHGNLKTRCRDCKGSAVCIHDRVKYSCSRCLKSVNDKSE
jgi:hypothetical protein